MAGGRGVEFGLQGATPPLSSSSDPMCLFQEMGLTPCDGSMFPQEEKPTWKRGLNLS